MSDITGPQPLTDAELADLPDPALWADDAVDLLSMALRLLVTVAAERAENARLRAELSEARCMRCGEWVRDIPAVRAALDSTTEADRGDTCIECDGDGGWWEGPLGSRVYVPCPEGCAALDSTTEADHTCGWSCDDPTCTANGTTEADLADIRMENAYGITEAENHQADST